MATKIKLGQLANNISNGIFAFFKAHLQSHYFPLDSIKQCASVSELPPISRTKENFKAHFVANIQYFIPFITLLAINIDTVYVFYLNNFHYNSTGMPELFTHKVFPAVMWPQGDLEMLMGIETEQIIYGLMLFTSSMPQKYIMYIVRCSDKCYRMYANRKAMNRQFSDKLSQFYTRTHKFLRVFMFIVFLELLLYWYVSLWFKESNTLRDWILRLYVPFFAIYSASGVCFIPLYFILNVHYIGIKQKIILQKARKNVVQLMQLKSHDLRNENKLNLCKRQFYETYHTVLALFDEIHAMDLFWQPYVTVDFIGYISMDCYLIHGFISDKSSFELGQRSFFVFFAIEIFAILVLVTAECSYIVHNNVEYYKLNRKFIYELNKKDSKMNLNIMLKMNNLISNYKGTRNGFRLISNALIDSTMFELLFFYLSTMFFKAF